ncbi:MAG: glutamyl-tRNA amidotransferase [Proteobacteria bacterium SG_bin7]|nr:MAG: glutamyl-tRNA amidotransferase [Proteobacteria bacterium SG_bin7]
MALRDQILEDIKTAMKAKDELTLGVLRMLNAAVKNREMELPAGIPMNESEVLSVLKKSVKQRQESIEQFDKAGRKDLSDKERAELKVVEKYLPQQMSREAVEKIVSEVVAALGANSIKQMGAVMKEVQARTAGAADNKIVSELVKAKLG